MSTSSPVTDLTTSGPVTKIRPSGPRITTSVRAGPYAAPPAAGPSTTEICGILPGRLRHRVEDQSHRVQGQHTLREARAAGVPETDDRRLVGDGALVRLDDHGAAVVAHRAAHDRRVGAEGDGVRAVDGADGREHAAVVVLADQLEAAGVEEGRQPGVGVARVLLARQLRRPVGARGRRSRSGVRRRGRCRGGWLPCCRSTSCRAWWSRGPPLNRRCARRWRRQRRHSRRRSRKSC